MIPTSIASEHNIGDTGPDHGKAQQFHHFITYTQPLPLRAAICLTPHCYLLDVGLELDSIVALVVSSIAALGDSAGSDVTEESTRGVSVALGDSAGSDVTEESTRGISVALGDSAGRDVTEESTGGISVVLGDSAGSDVTEESTGGISVALGDSAGRDVTEESTGGISVVLGASAGSDVDKETIEGSVSEGGELHVK